MHLSLLADGVRDSFDKSASIVIGRSDCSELPTDWTAAVVGRGFDVASLYAEVDALYAGSVSPGSISPRRREDVFRAFHHVPLAAVRIVIIGEDPYPNPDQADGLAFSASHFFNGPRPTSLARIFGSLRRDLNIEPTRSDLAGWADRGVLLINAALTHQSGSPSPDLRLWRSFTIAALSVVRGQKRPIAWLVWGEFANNVVDAIPVTNTAHRVFQNAHPRAGRASRETLAQRPPFASASAFLGSDPIADWSL